MASAVGLRFDFDGAGLRRLARLSGHANQVRRLLALAVIYDGGARHAAAEMREALWRPLSFTIFRSI
jgi:hypothetical protein